MELAKCSELQMTDALLKNGITKAEIESALAKQKNTLSTINNTTAIKSQTLSEEDELLQRWLSIGAEEADTIATNKNTVAKGANLSIINMLKVALSKLNKVIIANPLLSFGVAIVSTTAAMVWLMDLLETTPKEAKDAFDKTTEEVDSLKSEVDSLNSELDSTRSRIDELNAKDNLTLVEQEELNRLKETNAELERELRIKQDLLDVELKEANENAKKFFNTQVKGIETDINGQALDTDYITATEQRLEKIKQYEQEIKDLESDQLKYRKEHNGKSSYLLEEQIENRKNRIEEYKTYVNDAISDFMDSDDYLVEGLDDGLLARLDALYEKFDIYTNGKASVTENKLKDILAKADFQSIAKQLEELGKSGELSITTLSSKFPELIDYLDEAGISAEELYQYIMALSNPDALNYGEVEKQFKDSLGLLRDGAIKRDSDMQIWNSVKDAFSDEDWELTLQAYLKVKDQYGDHPEGWDAKDWISNIQAELNGSDSLETEISIIPTISSSVQQLATQLEPQFTKLGEAYKEIFQIDEKTGKEKFSLGDVDNSMLEGLRQSFAEIEEEIGVTFDASVLDPFFDTLTDSASIADDVQQAFNDLATAYFYSTDTLEQLNEETAEAITKQLEEMGVVNAQEVVYDELGKKAEFLAAQKKILAETGIDVANVSSDVALELLNEAGASEVARNYLFNLIAQEEIFGNTSLNVSDKVKQLQELATAYGQTAVAARIAAMQEMYANNHMPVDNANILAAAQEEINNAINNVHIDFSGVSGGSKKFGSGSGSSKDKWKEAYDKELKELEHMHEMGLISDEEYWQARLDLNEKYFGESSGKHDKYLDEYRDNEEDILEGLKKLWEDYYNERKDNLKDLISYAEKLYDKEIDSNEASIKILKEKRDAEKKYWQDQIDALKDANEERERAIDLQEKQWALQKAMHQRTILLYSESKGMHYVNDSKAERNAKNDLDSAENDNKIAELEKQLDAILEVYDSQIESINIQIDRLKEVKSAWSEIVDNQELKELEERLKSIFGGDVKDKILSGNTDFINSIISQYSSTSDMLRMIEDATLADIQNMVAQYGVLPENLMPIADAATDINNALGTVDTSGFNTNLDNTAQSSSNAAEKVQNVTTALNDLSNDISSYQMPAINTDNFTSAFTEDGGILSALNGFMERYKEICDGIPEIWNNSLAEAFGQGGGNGDPLSGGLPNDTRYDALFEPLVMALNNCKTNMETKLKECLGTFTSFQTDLSGVIGVGGGSDSTGASQSGAKGNSGQGSGGEKKSGSVSGSDTIVGSIQEGGSLIDEALNGEEESWSASFNTAAGSIHETATYIVECIESMVETIVSACISAIEAINMVASADENNSNNPTPSPYIGIGHSHGEIGNAYATGTKGRGLSHAEKNALVSEYGQREMTVFPNGKTVITDAPTAMDLPKGSVVYNEEETKKILNNKPDTSGNAYAKGTDSEGWWIGSDGHRYRDLQPGDRAYELQKAFEPMVDKILKGEMDIISNAVFEGQKQFERWSKQITNNTAISNITNNRNVQPVVNHINVTCPGVTEQQVAEQLGNVIGKELDKQFNGFHNYTDQMSRIR